MTNEDIPACLELCRAANWNQLENDWKIFLDLSPGQCIVAESGELVIGSVTTLRYQDSFSWIGMLLVHPLFRGKGIGKELLHQSLEILKNESTVKLDATPAGRLLYLKLNFKEEYQLSRMQAEALMHIHVEKKCFPIEENDWPAIALFDHKIFGADRQLLLKMIWKNNPSFAFIDKTGDEVKRYCLGRPGFNFTQIGPLVATDTSIAKNLLAEAIKSSSGKPIIIDTNHFNQDWIGWLKDTGFREQRPFIRMYYGAGFHSGKPGNEYAITGPEFG